MYASLDEGFLLLVCFVFFLKQKWLINKLRTEKYVIICFSSIPSNVLLNFNSTGAFKIISTIAVTNQIALHVFASMVALSLSDECWLLSSFLALRSSEQTIS